MDSNAEHKQRFQEKVGAHLDTVIDVYVFLIPARIRALLGDFVTWSKIYERLPGVTLKGALTPYRIRSQSPAAMAYIPTDLFALRNVLRYVGPEDVFVDLGCGKGRVLCFVAGRRKLKKVLGVEIVPELAQIARRKVANSRLLTPVEVIEGDAAKADLNEGTVFYLFNPFGEKTLRKVLSNIETSLSSNPRGIRILYYNPRCADVLDNTPWLQPSIEEDRRLEKEVRGRLRVRMWHN